MGMQRELRKIQQGTEAGRSFEAEVHTLFSKPALRHGSLNAPLSGGLISTFLVPFLLSHSGGKHTNSVY